MAARRILSLLAAKIPQNPLPTELSRKFQPSPNSFYRNYEHYTRKFQSLAESNLPAVGNSEEHENSTSSNPNPDTSKCISNQEKDETTVEHRVNSNLKISKRHDFYMMFTCKVCDTRSIKSACRESYDKGVVVVRCDGCNNLHLIADRLGWFGEPGSVEEFLAARGEKVKMGSVDSLNLTLEDLAGKKDILGV